MRWKIVLEYHGAGFDGWQLQPGRRTIQGVVEEAAAKLLGHEVRVAASGRTDAGVHAEGQVASFVTDVPRDERAVREGFNHFLPEDVACVGAERVPDHFDPRHWAWGKRYRYTWVDRPARSPLRRDRAWHVRKLDHERMAEAARCLVGRHDFSSFRAAGCAAKDPVREMEAWDVTRRGDEVHLEARGHGFLRHMVRIVAGTLTQVGLGKRDPAWVAEVLAARDRTVGGLTAPAHGLTLVSVTYTDSPPPWISYPRPGAEDEEE
jgi:tRNA pseudouridine38-40 synthase